MIESYEKTSDYFLELNSCGEQHLQNRNVTLHRKQGRKDYHILYITEGNCFIMQGGKEQRVEAGNIILFLPYEEQYYRFYKGGEAVSCFIHFTGSSCEQILTSLGFTDRVTFVGVSHTLKSFFSEMLNEYVANKPCKKEVLSSLLLRFLSYAGRNVNYIKNGIDVKLTKRMNEICACMQKDIACNYPVEYYAKRCALSESRFSHAFKESIGVSPKQYMLKLKVDTACRLLESTDGSVSEIAATVGINDANYFTKLVKRYTGHTPSYFRT